MTYHHLRKKLKHFFKISNIFLYFNRIYIYIYWKTHTRVYAKINKFNKRLMSVSYAIIMNCKECSSFITIYKYNLTTIDPLCMTKTRQNKCYKQMSNVTYSKYVPKNYFQMMWQRWHDRMNNFYWGSWCGCRAHFIIPN